MARRNPRDAALALRDARPDLHLPTREAWAALDRAAEAQDRTRVWASLPKRPPRGWQRIERHADGVALRRKDGRTVSASGRVEADGQRWPHVSLSRQGGLPTYHDLAAAKRQFLGDILCAYQVFAPAARHVNLAAVLHLWACIDRPRYLPDFTGGYDTS